MIIHYRWEHRQKKRYYRVIFSPDLFSEWVITRVWGGIGSAAGRITHFPCASYEEGISLIEKIAKKRLARGYVLCESSA